jgi:hypothetical protein
VEKLRAKGKWMNAELSERDKAQTGKKKRIQIQQEYERCMTEITRGVRECQKKKNDGEI